MLNLTKAHLIYRIHHNFEIPTCDPLKFKMGSLMGTCYVNWKIHQNKRVMPRTFQNNLPVANCSLGMGNIHLYIHLPVTSHYKLPDKRQVLLSGHDDVALFD